MDLGILRLTKTTTATFGAAVTFTNAFPTAPLLSNMHFGIESMNYDCNYYVFVSQFEMFM